MRRSLSTLVAILTLGAAPASAGIADSPLPELLPGAKTVHLYSVPGAIHLIGGFVTLFSCTSTASQPIQVGVETFSSFGASANDPVATSLSVNPGASVTFGTGLSAGFTLSSNLSSGGFSKGSARIMATSKNLICTAFIADALNSPPVSMTYLTIIAKTKQKAAN